MRRLGLACGLALVGACKGDDAQGSDEAETETGESGETGEGVAWAFDPIYGIANLDDDDLDGKYDWLQGVFDGDDEIYALEFPAELIDTLGGGEQIRLTLAGDLDAVRVWHGNEHVLGSGVGEPKPSYTFAPESGALVLPVVFGAYLARAELTLERLDAGGSVLEAATIELVASPLIMNHHLQAAEHFFIVNTGDNAEFVSAYQLALGGHLSVVPGANYLGDRWIQDELEFATSRDDAGGRFDTVIDSIRDRGLDDFPEDYFSMPNFAVETWGNSLNATSFDSFGNLDASPPIAGYPFGRIYYGREGNEGLDGVLAEFLTSQTIQAPFAVDTAWLCVGHVDEFSSFVPDPSAPRGFRMLISSTSAAYALIDSLDPSWDIGRYASAYGYATAGELADDVALRALNEDLQVNELDPLRARFVAELELGDEEIIEIPTLFDEVSGCGPYVVALTPGTVNLIVANVEGEGTKLMVPDPFFRDPALDPADDPLAQDFVQRMPAGLEVVFVDDWYSYHLADGEVHCGTNVLRTPAGEWWTEGAELLGLEGGN